jgi:nucleoid DNA-binding protein
MDISKYIGLYLVKNGYCSLPSLGTLSLEKIGAKRFDATTIDPPKYNITFNTVGSIDDKFPHFIAINENISTNNATNAISVFGREVKEEIANNRPFILDGIGRFTNAAGKVSFQQNPDLDLTEFTVIVPETQAPIVDNTRAAQAEKDGQQNIDFKTVLNNPEKESSFNLTKVIAPLGLLALILVGGYFGYNYLKSAQVNTATETPKTDSINTIAPVIVDTTIKQDSIKANPVDTIKPAATNAIDTTKPAAAAPVATGPAMKVAILTYRTEAKATEVSTRLSKNGNNTSVAKVDSINYQVVVSLPSTNRAPELVVDSLRRFFNPGDKNGKVVIVK